MNRTLTINKSSYTCSTFHLWWENKVKGSGTEVTWRVENGSTQERRALVTAHELGGRIAAPGLFEHLGEEFAAFVERPRNEILSDNETLVADIDTEKTLRDGWVKGGLSPASELEMHWESKTWIEAEAFCISRGGHLASVTTLVVDRPTQLICIWIFIC